MLPFTPFSCCCHHASHGQKSKLACLTHVKRADPILYQQLFFCISTSLATQRYTHTYSPFLWVWDYFSHWNLYAGRKEIITFTYAVYLYYRNPAALCVCVLHHHAVTRRHTDTQSTTATVIIAISQPYKCLADQLHCMVAQSHEIYQYYDFSTDQTLHPPSVKAHFRATEANMMFYPLPLLARIPLWQTIYFGKLIYCMWFSGKLWYI